MELPDDWIFYQNNSQGWFVTDDCTSEWWMCLSTNYISNDDSTGETGPDSDGSLDYMNSKFEC